ncbi:MAG: hypothetical protein RSB96_02755, partial [Oscillospiraceae bacterium]
NAKIINLSSERFRRLDLFFSIGYQNDFEQAKNIIKKCAFTSGYIDEKENESQGYNSIIRVCEHGENALKICCKVWVSYQNYWDLKYHILENVKLEIDKAGNNIPYNQLDIHIIKEKDRPN